MKLPSREIENFVRSPNPAARVILVYGPDDGLVSERSKTMGLSQVSDLSDPFNVTVLAAEDITADPSRLGDEAAAQSMMGGNRLVRVSGATDKISPAVKDYLATPDAYNLVIIEAGELGPRSPLRLICEKAKNAAAVPCYIDDEQGLSQVIRQFFSDQNRQIDPDAVVFLSANLGGNRLRTRTELEKLLTYKGNDSSAITLDDAQGAIGGQGAQGLDDLVMATGGAQTDKALSGFDRLNAEGVAVIAILRALQNHFRRLHKAKTLMDQGTPSKQAMQSLSPPVFFKQEAGFQAQINRWSFAGIESALSRLAEIEAQSKQTATPAETLCRQAILGLSRAR